MILFHAPRSPFARKARIVIHELGLGDAVQYRPIDPWTDETLRGANPLCKVPTLLLDDGSALYDSPVICEYLNDLAGGALLARSGPERWGALRRQALGDGLAEAVIRRYVESLGPGNGRSDGVVRRQEAAIAAALEALDGEVAQPGHARFDLGDIAVAVALGYFRFRSPGFAGSFDRPHIWSWLAAVEERPSVFSTRIATCATA